MRIDFSHLPEECEQLLTTLVRKQNGHRAQIIAFEKRDKQWRKVFGPFEAVIGKKGITSNKKEGDGKTPSGLYPLLMVFGREEHRVEYMPFVSIHEHLEAIDDPLSCYYNQIIDRRLVEVSDWRSSEKMQEVGFLYELGVVIGYNTPHPIAGKGSCIFLHVYRSLDSGTDGCTALSFKEVKTIAEWLKQDLSPHILQTVSF